MSRVSACSRGCKANFVTDITQDKPPLVKSQPPPVVPFSLVFTHHKLMGRPRPRPAARVLTRKPKFLSPDCRGKSLVGVCVFFVVFQPSDRCVCFFVISATYCSTVSRCLMILQCFSFQVFVRFVFMQSTLSAFTVSAGPQQRAPVHRRHDSFSHSHVSAHVVLGDRPVALNGESVSDSSSTPSTAASKSVGQSHQCGGDVRSGQILGTLRWSGNPTTSPTASSCAGPTTPVQEITTMHHNRAA